MCVDAGLVGFSFASATAISIADTVATIVCIDVLCKFTSQWGGIKVTSPLR